MIEMNEQASGKKPPAVYSLSRPSRCHNCDSKLNPGEIVRLQNMQEDREVLCARCAGLSGFAVLPAGNAKATRLAARYSPSHFVIMKWSQLWKCYERQGLLIEANAAQRLEEELGIRLPQRL
jgi:hypothetical protein